MNRIEKFKDIYDGPCFVCGRGPSSYELKKKWKYADGYVTIGVNSFELDFFVPTYVLVLDKLKIGHDYGVKNGVNLNNHLNTIINSQAEYVFSHYPLQDSEGFGLDTEKEVRYNTLELFNYNMDEMFNKNYLPRCNTSMITAIGLAIYMGFDQIGVIGFDLIGHPTEKNAKMLNKATKKIDEYCKKAGVEIVNLSSQSLLTGLPKMTLDTYYRLYCY